MKCDTRENLQHMDTTTRDTLQDLRVITPEVTADVLGISLSQLARLTATGAIGCVRIGLGAKRNHIGYLRRHVDAFLASREQAPS